MLRKFRYKEITWVDVESPTPEDLAELGRDYEIHPIVLAELTAPSERTKVDVYSDYLYLIFHFPLQPPQAPGTPTAPTHHQELDVVLGKNFIVTTHYEAIHPLLDFAKIFESDFALKKSTEKLHAGFIFFYIMREIYDALESNLQFVNNELRAVERKVFSGQEREVVETLTAINRELLDYRWSLKSHREILTSLEAAGTELFGAKFQYYLRAISGNHEKVWNAIENIRETFIDLRDTNDSLLAIKTNHTMKVLTVAAFVFLPLTIIPQLFGMNISHIPFAGHPLDFYLVLALMGVSSGILYVIARLKRWF